MRASLEVADIFRAAGPAYRAAHAGHLSLHQLKIMSAIEHCRTAALGGHVEACTDCGHWRIAYNSCRNRHCPMRCANGSGGSVSRPSISSPEAHGRMAISKASMPVFATNCSMVKSYTAWRRSGASPAGGAILTIASGRTAASDIDHRLRKRSRCQPGRSAPLRSASRPGWHRRRSSTNYATGPVIAGSPP